MPQTTNIPTRRRARQTAVKNVNELFVAHRTLSERAADWVASKVGSWTFIIVQSGLLLLWALLNLSALIKPWDPYPFILMNLILSLQAALTAPIIMMSQNRQAEHDRIEAHQDYILNQKTEQNVEAILLQLEAQSRQLAELAAALVPNSTSIPSYEEAPHSYSTP